MPPPWPLRGWRGRHGPSPGPALIRPAPGGRRRRRRAPPALRPDPGNTCGAETLFRAQCPQGCNGGEQLHVGRRNPVLRAAAVKEHLPGGCILDQPREGTPAVGLQHRVQLRSHGSRQRERGSIGERRQSLPGGQRRRILLPGGYWRGRRAASGPMKAGATSQRAGSSQDHYQNHEQRRRPGAQ